MSNNPSMSYSSTPTFYPTLKADYSNITTLEEESPYDYSFSESERIEAQEFFSSQEFTQISASLSNNND